MCRDEMYFFYFSYLTDTKWHCRDRLKGCFRGWTIWNRNECKYKGGEECRHTYLPTYEVLQVRYVTYLGRYAGVS